LKLLVTGADGFTGLHFAKQAVNAGFEVIPLKSNLSDKEAIVAEIQASRPTVVVHLAAISFVGHSNDNEFYAVNVIGTINLLEALTKLPTPPLRVVLTSSANVYGNCDLSPITEMQTPAPVNNYAMSKLAMEHMARTYSDRLPIVITRPFNYTGPGQAKHFVIPKLVHHFAQRLPTVELGNLNVEREFNDVSMVCDTYLKLIKFGVAGEIYNVCSGEPYTLSHVISSLERLTGHQVKVEINPAFVRANEVHRLCGSPAKYRGVLSANNIPIEALTLEQTLERMLVNQ
jgi:GDP-6-deoxy-D-talose 4-dehydrogenase